MNGECEEWDSEGVKGVETRWEKPGGRKSSGGGILGWTALNVGKGKRGKEEGERSEGWGGGFRARVRNEDDGESEGGGDPLSLSRIAAGCGWLKHGDGKSWEMCYSTRIEKPKENGRVWSIGGLCEEDSVQ